MWNSYSPDYSNIIEPHWKASATPDCAHLIYWEMELKDDDLVKVWDAVYDIRAKCYDFGVMLKVPPTTLDSIRADYSKSSDQLREILKVWLRTSTQRTWQTLADALKSRIVGELTLASDIEAKYCQDKPGQASGQPRYTQVQASQGSQRQMQLQLMELELQLQSSTQSQETTERLQRELQELQRAIEALQTHQELKQLPSMKQPAARPQPELKQLPPMKRPAARPQPNPPQQETTLRKLIWRDGPKAPEIMFTGSIPTDGTTVYCNGWGLGSTSVHQYHSDTQQWRTLPDLPHSYSTLMMADSKLTSVGGYDGRATDSLLSLTGEGKDRKWLQLFPPMPTKRCSTAAICHARSLIVTGGHDDRNTLATVEVLNIDTLLWSIASSLPHPFTLATTLICGERLYLLGGVDQTGYPGTCSVLTAAISELLDSCQTLSQSTIWRHVSNAPYKRSACATLCGQLVAVGGIDEANKATTAVSVYDDITNSWLPMEAMKTPRWGARVASLHDNTMLVIGGFNGQYLVTVEIAKLS